MIETIPDYPALQAIQRALWHLGDVRGAAVMVGSGFSMNAELASPTSKAPPLWSHMAAEMNRHLGNKATGIQNPLRLAEEFRALLGQAALDGLIRDLIADAEWLPGNAHRRLLMLPWSDVLSTNWDTLLERTRADLTDRSYDLVLTPKDISRTRSPRIIKLHGSLPSHTPLIFAEEDYRTYPTKFAPFVNLAQHILLENELLLLGFSGDDPNFLAWAGWVRDQLGTSARRIRLAGILNLTTSQRRYLENLNVTPIDLSPLTSSIVDPKQQHARATELLLDSLHMAKPRPVHVWTRSGTTIDSKWKELPAETLANVVLDAWAKDREAAPAWLVAPHIERDRLRMETNEAAIKVAGDVDKLNPQLQGRYAGELAWRLEVGHFSVPEWAKRPLELAIDNEKSALSIEERRRILILLSYHAIEVRDVSLFERHVEALEASRQLDTDAGPWAAYLRGLRARDCLNLSGIAAVLPNIVGDDPVWMLRRALLHCAICESVKAAKLVRKAVIEIRRRRALDRRSLWLLSRESWINFLWNALSFELRQEDAQGEAINIENDWPAIYGANHIDPWDELNSLDRVLRENQEQKHEDSGGEKVHFDAGSWTPRDNKPTRYVASWVIEGEWQIRRLADFVGLPAYSSFHDIIGGRLRRAAIISGASTDASAVWRVASYLRSEDDNLINGWFGRIEVAALPLELVRELVAALRGAIGYLASIEGDHDRDYTFRVQRRRVFTELLSRLAVRSDVATAEQLVELGTSVFERNHSVHWWLYKPTAKLIERSLSAIPVSEKSKYVWRAINFPLPAEMRDGLPDHDWPELSDIFRFKGLQINRPKDEWDFRISELIGWVEKAEDESRHRSILRLSLLYQKDALTKLEIQRFAAALWSKRKSPLGLPADKWFFPGFFVNLPEPEIGIAASGFDHDVIQPLLSGKFDKAKLGSLTYIGSEADEGRGKRPFTATIALELVRAILKCQEKELEKSAALAISIGLLPTVPLDQDTFDDLWKRAVASDAVFAVSFLPYLVKSQPGKLKEAIGCIRRVMNARKFEVVEAALNAIKQWTKIVDAEYFPDQLASAVASIVAIRRDPGLFYALDICVGLVSRKMFTEEDIQRVLDGLSALLEETKYGEWRQEDFRTATLTFVRANAYRLALALRHGGYSDLVIDSWIVAGSSDPVPEVRYVVDYDG